MIEYDTEVKVNKWVLKIDSILETGRQYFLRMASVVYYICVYVAIVYLVMYFV